jgi:hypothetical protein
VLADLYYTDYAEQQAPSARRNKLMSLTIGGAHLSDLSLDFTVPGHGIELKVS